MLKVFELDVRKLVGFGEDGCSTMIGDKSDVVVRLRRSGSPSMVSFHCPAHRLQLGILDVAGKVSSSKHGTNIRMHLSCKLSKCSRTLTVSIRIPPKRRGQLTNTVTREDQLFNAFLEAMESEVEEGERDLEKFPTLRLQK